MIHSARNFSCVPGNEVVGRPVGKKLVGRTRNSSETSCGTQTQQGADLALKKYPPRARVQQCLPPHDADEIRHTTSNKLWCANSEEESDSRFPQTIVYRQHAGRFYPWVL